MELFKDYLGNTVDIDDISIYSDEWKEMDICSFFSKCMKEAGSSLFYMNFLHAHEDWSPQKKKVEVLCVELSDIWNYIRKIEYNSKEHIIINENEYKIALMKWLYRFEDETENQC